MLFITSWCRKRANTLSSPPEPSTMMLSAFPAPISASFTPPTSHMGLTPMSLGKYRPRTHNSANARRRGSKQNLKGAANGSSGLSGTIPIRSVHTPQRADHGRLATSAPSAFMDIPTTPGSASNIARMTAGGFKPRPTPARVMMNATRESTPTRSIPAPVKTVSAGKNEVEEASRVRKDRSESTTPGATIPPSLLEQRMAKSKAVPDPKGKRTKV